MQVVLLEDVKALGKKGQVVNVNDGYARNLIPSKKLRVEADPENLSDLKLKKANNDKIAAEQLAAARKLGARLGESSVTLTIKAGEDGRASESVSSKETDRIIGDQLGIDTDKKKVMLDNLIESIDSFEVPVKLHKEMTAGLAVKVVEA